MLSFALKALLNLVTAVTAQLKCNLLISVTNSYKLRGTKEFVNPL